MKAIYWLCHIDINFNIESVYNLRNLYIKNFAKI